jgi:flagellar basal body rod protein FlgG
MIYGLYLSATGVLANAHRQDVIANNLANAETVGFRRDLALFQQRRTRSQADAEHSDWTSGLLEGLGGGLSLSPTQVDRTQGELEPTGNRLDAAIVGRGYFMVDDHGAQRLTRNGQFLIDQQGYLILADGSGQRVLGVDRKPIRLDGAAAGSTTIAEDGLISQSGQAVAQLGVFDVADDLPLTKQGMLMLNAPNAEQLRLTDSPVRGEFVERANVDPAIELTHLMDAQRQLEANANMIRYQDQMLAKLVNEVGKIS